jgi:hypothetical protein
MDYLDKPFQPSHVTANSGGQFLMSPLVQFFHVARQGLRIEERFPKSDA